VSRLDDEEEIGRGQTKIWGIRVILGGRHNFEREFRMQKLQIIIIEA